MIEKNNWRNNINSKELKKITSEIENGVDFDIWNEAEDMIIAISKHFEFCNECRNDFDEWSVGESFESFERKLGVTNDLKCWICDKE